MLGLNIGSHDSGVALLDIKDPRNYSLIAYQEERFTKKKHEGRFPFIALKMLQADFPEALEKLSPDEIASNSFFMNPIEIEVDYLRLPQYKDKLEAFQFQKFSTLFNKEITRPGHHLSHAYSAWGFSPFEKSLIIVFDGCGSKRGAFEDYFNESQMGEKTEGDFYETLSIYTLDQGVITPIHKEWTSFEAVEKVDHFFGDALGNLFSLSASRIFGNWMEAGKVMGLSAYGSATPIKSKLEFQKKIVEGEFKIYKGKDQFDSQPESDFKTSANIAASVQAKFEEEVVGLCQKLNQDYPDYENVIMVGGCALNCLTNSLLLEKGLFKNVFVPPFPNDEGIAMGTALFLAHQKKQIEFRTIDPNKMHAYLGRKQPSYSQEKLTEAFPDFEFLDFKRAPEILAQGEIIALFQGASEVGPRALGNRSLLVRPDRKEVKAYLNQNIKFREDFRPYGATVLAEDVAKYFHVNDNFVAPFMTFAPKIREGKRAYLKGVTHQDSTCRIQTITREQNQRYYDLINDFKKLSGESVILNTSLNIMGQPILESLKDAQVFMQTSKVNYLIFNEYFLMRKK